MQVQESRLQSALIIVPEPTLEVRKRCILGLWPLGQALLGGIHQDTGRLLENEYLVEGLVRRDGAGFVLRTVIPGIDIHDYAVEGVVALTDALSERKSGSQGLHHGRMVSAAG